MSARLELAEFIAKRTMSAQSMDELTQALAAYVLEEHLSNELDSLLRDVLAYRAAHGHIEATVVSAHPLTDAVREDVRAVIADEMPQAKSVLLQETIDPSVVGGIRIELAGKELDLTVKAKLNTFKRLTAAQGRTSA